MAPVVVATGLNPGIREKLGVTRTSSSAGHSISIGFDAKPADPRGFPFPALTYFSESPADKMAYITLFPIGNAMRANLFGYRHLHDPSAGCAKNAACEQRFYGIRWPGPRRTLMGATSPWGRLRQDRSGRSLDVTYGGYRQPGGVAARRRVARDVLPAGTGAQGAGRRRAPLRCIPRWLKTPGMGARTRSAMFYDDPGSRRACDGVSRASKALRPARVPRCRHVAFRRCTALIKFDLHWGQGHTWYMTPRTSSTMQSITIEGAGAEVGSAATVT